MITKNPPCISMTIALTYSSLLVQAYQEALRYNESSLYVSNLCNMNGGQCNVIQTDVHNHCTTLVYSLLIGVGVGYF